MSSRSLIRRAAGAGLAGLLLLTLSTPARAEGGVPIVVLDGTGYGHGVGLSQWGAEYLARTGRSVDQILATFYPGAGLGQATGAVRVAVHKPPVATTTLTFPQGGEVRSPLEGPQAPGFPVRVGPGGRVRITFDGAYRVDAMMGARGAGRATAYQQEPCPLLGVCTTPPTQPPTPAPTTTTTAPPPPPPSGGPPPSQPAPPPSQGGAPPPGSPTSSAPVWSVPAGGGVTTVDDRGRSYRGVVEATGGGALRLVNHLGVEDYLRGMAEVPGTWPAAAVQAQTVAARTYALRAMQSGGEICDDARCQVYVGRTAESPGQDAAVAATAKKVVTHGGKLAAAVYSADAGGVSATTLEGFGTPDGVYPYLTTVRYETDNPLPWRLEVALADIAARLGYRGTLTGVRVGSTGPSGRALEMVLEGSSGDKVVDGRSFGRALGLRSTRFTVTTGTAATAPPPPPMDAGALQALPDEAAAIARQPARPSMDDRLLRSGRVPAAPGIDDALRGWHPLTLVGVLALSGLVGAHLPLLLDRLPAPAGGVVAGRARARALRAWRVLTRSR